MILQRQAGHSILVQPGRIENINVKPRIRVPAQQVTVDAVVDAQIVEQIILAHPEVTEQLFVDPIDGLFDHGLKRYIRTFLY